MKKPIGIAAVHPYGEVPVYNPHTAPETSIHVLLEEPIVEHQLDANRAGVLKRPGGFLRVRVNKQTRNGEAIFRIYSC